MLTRCTEYLDQRGVPYSHAMHPPALTRREIAIAERRPGHSLVTASIYHDGAGYGMIVVPEGCRADPVKVAALLGRAEIRPATERELADRYPDSEIDAMPPFGNLLGLPVLVDAEVASHPILVFHPGTKRDVLRVTFLDFRRLVNPLIASFATAAAPPRIFSAIRSHSSIRCRPRSENLLNRGGITVKLGADGV